MTPSKTGTAAPVGRTGPDAADVDSAELDAAELDAADVDVAAQDAADRGAADLDRAATEALLARQTEILEQIAAGEPLELVLTGITATLEALVPGCYCSVLLFDGVAGTLHHGAAPSLPSAYIAGINGLPAGADAGSCGTAAYLGRPIVAVDIRLDSRWERYRSLADGFGLRSCWSTPIRGRGGITGTFAVYHREPHRPTPREEHLVQRLTHLASVAIDHDRLLGALTESEERFRRAFQDNAVGMALATLDGEITRVNGALRTMLGRTEAALIGRRLDELLTPRPSSTDGTDRLAAVDGAGTSTTVDGVGSPTRGDGAGSSIATNGGLTPGRQHQHEATASTADGRVLDLAVAVSPIRGTDGEPRALSVNVLDITERRAAERERRRRVEAELAQHAAEAANRSKTDFLAALGHELRTPLQAITGFTELLGTLELPGDRRAAALTHIHAAADHILAMVNEVLDVARLESGALPLSLAEVPLAPLVQEVCAMLGPLAGAERVTLTVSAERLAGFRLWADERRVRQVLLNLVGNGIRYNRDGGTVTIDAEPTPDDDRVRISLQDTGHGIAADQLSRLFTPFDRLGADSEEGVGLGLPLARGLTEAMGGTLEVHSEIGAGTTVTVTLPIGH